MSHVDHDRRRVLQGSVMAGVGLFSTATVRAWAQSPVTLLSLPKLALVIGNGGYRHVPALRNPTNDARGLAAALKPAGFDVALKLDAGRAEMLAAIDTHVEALVKKKGVGLFFFAGHGLQLAWRNFLLPVDAVVRKAEDVETQAVELDSLLQGITTAANAMNLIILDACRDNPFGVEQKGLSQMDAPPSTLLAYATAPGNTASDGAGANSFYTEHLLKELQVQGAKVEDVFKRVRLGVRRKSHGRQIPWESTSLEEDFYFLPPPHLKKLSDEERDRRFTEERALWERVRDAREPALLEDYLQRYPSGNFAELAQLQLDRVLAKQGEKKVQVAPAEGNPYTKGSAVTNTHRKIGDSYGYRALDLGSRKEKRNFTSTITQISDTEVIFSDGFVTDLLGNTRRDQEGRRFSANQNIPVEFAIGKRWQTQFTVTNPQGYPGTVEMQYRVAARETVTVPAGAFNAFRVEGKGWSLLDTRGGPQSTEIIRREWFAPDTVRASVALELERRTRGLRVVTSERVELVSYKEG